MMNLRRALATAVGVGLLAGCASTAPPPATPARPAAPPPTAAPATLDQVADFERSQVRRATANEQQGRLAEAALAWESLTVLRPENTGYASSLQQIRKRIAMAVADGLARAAEEQRRGDLDRASRAYLQVLALAPEHRLAADALRAIERERNQRNFVGRFSRNTMSRTATAEADPRPAAARSTGLAPGDDRNLVEHASMLAGQGELDAAILLLARPAEERSADPELRRLLADLYFRKADSLLPQRVAEAITALERCLKADPNHRAAKAQLQTLRVAAPR